MSCIVESYRLVSNDEIMNGTVEEERPTESRERSRIARIIRHLSADDISAISGLTTDELIDNVRERTSEETFVKECPEDDVACGKVDVDVVEASQEHEHEEQSQEPTEEPSQEQEREHILVDKQEFIELREMFGEIMNILRSELIESAEGEDDEHTSPYIKTIESYIEHNNDRLKAITGSD